MTETQIKDFLKRCTDAGATPHDALEALADEAHDRGDHWTGFNARMAALDFIRPRDCAIGRF